MRPIFWWTFLSGACGYIYAIRFTATTFVVSGSTAVGGYNTATPLWKNNLNSPGVAAFGVLIKLFNTIEWSNLAPDRSHIVGIAGYGTPAATGTYKRIPTLPSLQRQTAPWRWPIFRRAAATH